MIFSPIKQHNRQTVGVGARRLHLLTFVPDCRNSSWADWSFIIFICIPVTLSVNWVKVWCCWKQNHSPTVPPIKITRNKTRWTEEEFAPTRTSDSTTSFLKKFSSCLWLFLLFRRLAVIFPPPAKGHDVPSRQKGDSEDRKCRWSSSPGAQLLLGGDVGIDRWKKGGVERVKSLRSSRGEGELVSGRSETSPTCGCHLTAPLRARCVNAAPSPARVLCAVRFTLVACPSELRG